MIEHLTIINTTSEGFNWSAIEAIGTVISGVATLAILIYTICSSKKQIDFEKKKYQHAIEDAINRQRQQTLEIVKEFYSKGDVSLEEDIKLLRDKINTYYFSLNKEFICYLEELKEKAIALHNLDLKLKRANAEAGRETESEAFIKKQAEIHKLEEERGKIAIWIAERGDNAKVEIYELPVS